MAQFEEKLGAILNDPQTMSRIMAIAQSLDAGKSSGPAQPRTAEQDPEAEPAGEDAQPGLEVDPRLMEAGMRALEVYQGPDDSRTALLQALRPFLKPERHAKLDRAVRITKLSKVVRAALDTFKGGGGDV